jgi:hypothetical protein
MRIADTYDAISVTSAMAGKRTAPKAETRTWRYE